MTAGRAASLVAVVAVVVSACGSGDTEADRFKSTCHDVGGYVSIKRQAWGVDYACVGQTTGTPLPVMSG